MKIEKKHPALLPALFSNALLATLARYAPQGVPLFFVISGYCMYAAAQNTLAAHRAPAIFLKRRMWRIFPPFWLSVVVVILAPYLLTIAGTAVLCYVFYLLAEKPFRAYAKRVDAAQAPAALLAARAGT